MKARVNTVKFGHVTEKPVEECYLIPFRELGQSSPNQTGHYVGKIMDIERKRLRNNLIDCNSERGSAVVTCLLLKKNLPLIGHKGMPQNS